MVGHAMHMGWLTNVLDGYGLQHFSQATTFYQEGLATHMKELFGDLLEPNSNLKDDEGRRGVEDARQGPAGVTGVR